MYPGYRSISRLFDDALAHGIGRHHPERVFQLCTHRAPRLRFSGAHSRALRHAAVGITNEIRCASPANPDRRHAHGLFQFRRLPAGVQRAVRAVRCSPVCDCSLAAAVAAALLTSPAIDRRSKSRARPARPGKPNRPRGRARPRRWRRPQFCRHRHRPPSRPRHRWPSRPRHRPPSRHRRQRSGNPSPSVPSPANTSSAAPHRARRHRACRRRPGRRLRRPRRCRPPRAGRRRADCRTALSNSAANCSTTQRLCLLHDRRCVQGRPPLRLVDSTPAGRPNSSPGPPLCPRDARSGDRNGRRARADQAPHRGGRRVPASVRPSARFRGRRSPTVPAPELMHQSRLPAAPLP